MGTPGPRVVLGAGGAAVVKGGGASVVANVVVMGGPGVGYVANLASRRNFLNKPRLDDVIQQSA